MTSYGGPGLSRRRKRRRGDLHPILPATEARSERFAKEHGPLRPVVERVLRGFIRCGIPRHGFARVLCDTCRVTYAVPFSCRTRSFCPSCEKKRALLWAEWVRGELLEAVAHRHVVFTIPRLLRPLFRRRRELLSELGTTSG